MGKWLQENFVTHWSVKNAHVGPDALVRAGGHCCPLVAPQGVAGRVRAPVPTWSVTSDGAWVPARSAHPEPWKASSANGRVIRRRLPRKSSRAFLPEHCGRSLDRRRRAQFLARRSTSQEFVEKHTQDTLRDCRCGKGQGACHCAPKTRRAQVRGARLRNN